MSMHMVRSMQSGFLSAVFYLKNIQAFAFRGFFAAGSEPLPDNSSAVQAGLDTVHVHQPGFVLNCNRLFSATC